MLQQGIPRVQREPFRLPSIYAADCSRQRSCRLERGTDTLTTLRSSSQGVDSSKAHSRKLRERSANSRGTQYPSTALNDFHIQ